MQTMVVMDERIVRYLLHLVHRYGDTTWPTHGEAVHAQSPVCPERAGAGQER
jgi:hypothetical protein